ncbi:MAG: PLP-dependent aminotransferase family protein [Rhodospirillaceae bacterium]|jgi:2-aminoadipate transaminase|nr:PLP-dependent aminotransferase family protein [Rhodospirillaceae bacterium]MBT5457587.1 PLP-dependent aminotransferase family protein [Rhodospirillaceae bacterium]MBT6828450.1 PLP-dependent aminotransferase family protein [Rhodospirillaceae bacterium]
MAFDYSPLFRSDLPAPAQRWSGFPRYNFIGGHNDAGAVPVDEFIAASQSVLARDGQTLATYGLSSGPQGYQPLRAFLATSIGQNTGMQISADDVLIVSGSLQALDLVNDVLLSPGDTVIIEEATYQGAIQRLDRLGVRYIGAPLDAGGIRMDALSDILNRLKAEGTTPKYIYTVPTVQNPTGTIMPEERRVELLGLARTHGVPIFEDDCYAELTFSGARPKAIRALDDGGQVIYCGSFSKTIAPALRIGYIVADWAVLSRLLPAKHDGGTGALEQMVLAEYCQTHFDDHVATHRGVLKQKCDAIMEALSAEFGTDAEFSEPTGGIFIWVTLPEVVDTSRLAEAAMAEGVALNPGAEWCADPESGKHQLRLCFGNPTLKDIRDGVAKLADICHRETGIPARGGNRER